MYNFVWSVRSLPLMVGPYVLWQTRCKVPWVLNLSRLRYSCQCCTLAVAQYCPSHRARGRWIFGKYLNAHLKFAVYGHKQASKHINTLPQCSPASVGLAQARPNYSCSVGILWTVHCLLVLLTHSNSQATTTITTVHSLKKSTHPGTSPSVCLLKLCILLLPQLSQVHPMSHLLHYEATRSEPYSCNDQHHKDYHAQ